MAALAVRLALPAFPRLIFFVPLLRSNWRQQALRGKLGNAHARGLHAAGKSTRGGNRKCQYYAQCLEDGRSPSIGRVSTVIRVAVIDELLSYRTILLGSTAIQPSGDGTASMIAASRARTAIESGIK